MFVCVCVFMFVCVCVCVCVFVSDPLPYFGEHACIYVHLTYDIICGCVWECECVGGWVGGWV